MQDRYDGLKKAFADRDGVTVSTGRGAQGMKANSKMFAMFFKGQLLLRLPTDRVAELIAAGEGEAYDPGTGAMPDRLIVPYGNENRWIELSEESLRYVGSK